MTIPRSTSNQSVRLAQSRTPKLRRRNASHRWFKVSASCVVSGMFFFLLLGSTSWILLSYSSSFSSSSSSSRRRHHLPLELELSPVRNASIVMGGLFLNNGVHSTLKIHDLMSRTVSYFREHTLIVLENDSTDGTTRTLQRLCDSDDETICINLRGFKKKNKKTNNDYNNNNNNILRRFQSQNMVSMKDNPDLNPAFSQERFSRMSWYRNMLLHRVIRMMTTDYFVMCDPDLFKEAWMPTKKEIFDEFNKTPGFHEIITSSSSTTTTATTTMTANAKNRKKRIISIPKFGNGIGRAWKSTSVLKSIHRANIQQPNWSVICFNGVLGDQSTLYDMLAFRLSEQTPIPEMAQWYRPLWTRSDWNFHLSGLSIENRKANDTELHMAMFLFGYGPITTTSSSSSSSSSSSTTKTSSSTTTITTAQTLLKSSSSSSVQQQQQQQQHDFIPVKSCFGGLAIYKISKLRDSKCVYDEEAQDCEHVTLNECLFQTYPNSIFLDAHSRVYYDAVSPE